MNTKAPETTGEILATHFRAVAERRANSNFLAGDRAQVYREMDVTSIYVDQVRVVYPEQTGSAGMAELVMDQAASEVGVDVEYHYDRSGSFLVIWSHR